MSLKFCTWNVLDAKNIYANLRCEKPTPEYISDNIFRYTVIINILIANKFDIICLQEVSEELLQMITNSELNKDFNVFHKNTQCILTSKTKIMKPAIVKLDNLVHKQGAYYVEYKGSFNSFFIVKGTTSGKNLHIVNMHLPNDPTNREGVLAITERYLAKNSHADCAVIAGDMNQENNLLSNKNPDTTLDKQKTDQTINVGKITYKKLFPLSVDDKTSYSLVTCGPGQRNIKQFKDDPFKANDHIYILGSITADKVVAFDNFDKNSYGLEVSNTFKTYGPPYCFTDNLQNLKECKVATYKYAYDNLETKWPSDHMLLSVNLVIEPEKMLSHFSGTPLRVEGLSSKAREFVPGRFKGGDEIDYYKKYIKYKQKYFELKNK